MGCRRGASVGSNRDRQLPRRQVQLRAAAARHRAFGQSTGPDRPILRSAPARGRSARLPKADRRERRFAAARFARALQSSIRRHTLIGTAFETGWIERSTNGSRMAERYVAADPYPWPFNGDLRPENTALIVIDMQIDFCGIGGYGDPVGHAPPLSRATSTPIPALPA